MNSSIEPALGEFSAAQDDTYRELVRASRSLAKLADRMQGQAPPSSVDAVREGVTCLREAVQEYAGGGRPVATEFVAAAVARARGRRVLSPLPTE